MVWTLWRTPTSRSSPTSRTTTKNGDNASSSTSARATWTRNRKRQPSTWWHPSVASLGSRSREPMRKQLNLKKVSWWSSPSWTRPSSTTIKSKCLEPSSASSLDLIDEKDKPWSTTWQTTEKLLLKLRNMASASPTRSLDGDELDSPPGRSRWSKDVHQPSPRSLSWKPSTSCSAKTTKDVPVTIKAGNLVRAMVLPDGPATRTTWWRTPTRWMMKTGLMNLTMMHQPGNNGMMKPMRWTRTTRMATTPTPWRRTTLTTSTTLKLNNTMRRSMRPTWMPVARWRTWKPAVAFTPWLHWLTTLLCRALQAAKPHDLQSRKARASQRRDAKDLRPGNPKVDKYKQEDKLPQSAYAAAKQAIGQPIAHRDLRDQVRLQRAPMHPHRTLRAKRPKLMAL